MRRRPGGGLDTEVVLVDTFGNVQLAASAAQLAEARLSPPMRAWLWPARQEAVEIAVGVTFASVAPGEPLLYVDAAGMAALAVRDGDAARTLGLAPGDRLALQPG
ncbi:SAM hydroxide adenosyltransferase [Frankia sp. AgKG'84/4]|uniref:SAM hydroxide adenosyltransferase n=1 Tax=Frankia sp. AgKG'84/4 TaxID=573490 RepID=UPI00202AB201|nr:SAM hydroxide adenosyltransferase [Frankia sp. AgKG'84/4]MCL9795072.1 SAM-dependent chlorinase/fluorinase [Frankia sp. AgKG'84/4]